MLDKLYNEGLRVLGPDYYKSFTYEGMRFVGTTCWYPDTALVRKRLMNWSDVAYIRGFMKWWEKFQLEERKHLWANMQEGDIVVSHMLPSFNCVSPEWANNPDNCLYVGKSFDDKSQLINGKAYNKITIPPFDFAKCLVDAGFKRDEHCLFVGQSLDSALVWINDVGRSLNGGRDIEPTPANAKIIIDMAELAKGIK